MMRRDFLAAAAATPAVGILSGVPSSLSKPRAGNTRSDAKDRYFRIYRVDDDGTETVIAPCLPEIAAEAFVRSYNELGRHKPRRAEAREIDVSCAPLVGAEQKVEQVKLWALCGKPKPKDGDPGHLYGIFDSKRAAKVARGDDIGIEGGRSAYSIRQVTATFGRHGYWTLLQSLYGQMMACDSLLDVPSNADPGGEQFLPASFRQTRQEAIEDAVEANLETLRDWHAKRKAGGEDWHKEWFNWAVVVELGEIDVPVLWSGQVRAGSGGLGTLDIHSEHVVRVTEITDEEAAQYPVPADLRVKGGAA